MHSGRIYTVRTKRKRIRMQLDHSQKKCEPSASRVVHVARSTLYCTYDQQIYSPRAGLYAMHDRSQCVQPPNRSRSFTSTFYLNEKKSPSQNIIIQGHSRIFGGCLKIQVHFQYISGHSQNFRTFKVFKDLYEPCFQVLSIGYL